MGSQDREDLWQGGCQTGQSHICMWISWEEQMGSETDCTTQGSNAGKESLKNAGCKNCGGCGGRRNSQSHRRILWRDPQGPRGYTNPPTWESAPEGPNLHGGSRGSDRKRGKSPASSIVPSLILSRIQCHKVASWVSLSWQIPKAPPLTT